MVLTRRAAKAAAEAAAKAEAALQSPQTTELAPPSLPPSVSPRQDPANSPISPLSPESTSPPHPSPPFQENTPEDPPIIPHEKPPAPTIASRLGIGHVTAITAVIALVHAASHEPNSPLPLHAIILLLCTVPLRIYLVLSEPKSLVSIRESALLLALKGSVVFSSNALHMLATMAWPSSLLPLIVCAVCDVSANWLKMTIHARIPYVESNLILYASVDTAADIFLTALISHQQFVIDTLLPFFIIRFFFNLRVILLSCLAILSKEKANRKNHHPTNSPR